MYYTEKTERNNFHSEIASKFHKKIKNKPSSTIKYDIFKKYWNPSIFL